MEEQLSPESRRLTEMVERTQAKMLVRLPETLARLRSANARVKAAEEQEARARDYCLTMEAATEAWKTEAKGQLKTAWIQIKRSSRFGLLLYMGYLLARPGLGFSEIAILAF